MELTVTTEGFSQMAARLKASKQTINKASRTMLDKATAVASAKAKTTAPVDKGQLRSSITRKWDEKVGTVGTNISYAKYQEFGTGIYGKRGSPITPKRGKYLVFKPKGAKNYVFARQVMGVKPKRFITQGLEAVKAEMKEIVAFGVGIIRKELGF